MRRILCMFLLLLFITPVFAEGLPSVDDAILADDGSVEISYFIPQTCEASLVLLDPQGYEIQTIFTPRTLLAGRHVLQLPAGFFAPALKDGSYTLFLKTAAGEARALLTAGNPSIQEPAPTEQPELIEQPTESKAAITPSLRSDYRPHHENCYWCTPMDITDEAAVWSMLTAPMTVVNLNQRDHTVLYAEPDTNSEQIALITGDSQGVHVLETLDNGWSLVEVYSTSFFDSTVKNWNAFETGYIRTDKLKQVNVNQQYGIVVDKLTQRLYLFKDGHLETTLACSTGLYNAKQPYNETRSGEFLIISFTGSITSDNLICDYALRYNDDDYLHEVPHTGEGKNKDFSRGDAKLGTRSSHGCIRVQHKTNVDGYTMAKVYELLKESTRATKLNVRLVIWEDYQGRQIPIPASNTPLYYNPNGGVNYHKVADCPGVKKQYLPLTAFTYGELENAPYSKLTPCGNCWPDLRVSDIEKINAEHLTQSPGEIMSIIGK
ncbi:MAG: L,D-transpeptidase [Clostridia bacterium]|nr:L,D-transpeptidase [Clostridia bacterium]